MPSTYPRPLLVVFVCSPFLALATWHVWTPYSLWYDELFSAGLAASSWRALLPAILNDVHPPLYLVVLKTWIAIAGDGEVALRTLSLVCALAAFAYLAVGSSRRSPVFALAAGAYFASSALFPDYAQEARSYSLLLFCATVATLMDRRRAASGVREPDAAWLAALVVLSLVHYFGLLYAAVLLLGDLWRVRCERRAVAWNIAAGALMLVWPLAHATVGQIGRRTGGHFWIRVDGVQDTLWIFTRAVLGVRFLIEPDAISIGRAAAFGLVLALAVVLATPPARREMTAIGIRIAAVVGLAATIDLHTPVSTVRNYIVLLPVVAWLFGEMIGALWDASRLASRRALVAAVLVGFVSVSAIDAARAMTERWTPRQNIKGLAQSVEAAGVCRPHCWFASWHSHHSYYFHNSVGRSSAESVVPFDDLLTGEHSVTLPIVAIDVGRRDLELLERRYPDWTCLQPPQSWLDGKVALLKASPEPVAGLFPCHR